MAGKGTRYSEEQIIRILKEVESGITVAEVCRKHGVAEQTVYRWRNKYDGLDAGKLQRLREMGAEAWLVGHSPADPPLLPMFY